MALLLIRVVAHVYMALSVVRPLQTIEISNHYFQLISTEYRTVGLASSKRKLASQAWRHTGLFCLLSARFSVLIFLLFARAILEEVKHYRIAAQPSLPQPSLPQPKLIQSTLPQPKLVQPSLPQSALPQPKLVQPSLPQSTLPQPKLVQPSLPQSTLPQPKLVQPSLPQPKLIQSTLPQPDTPPVIVEKPKELESIKVDEKTQSWPTSKTTSTPPTPPTEEDMEYESLIDNNSDNLGKMNDSFEPSQKELPTPPLHPKDPKDSLVIPPFPPADLGLSPVNEETEEQLFTDIVSIEPTISAPELHPQPIMVAPKKLIALPQPSSQPASPPLNSSLSTPVPARPPPLTETKSRPPSEHRYSHSSTSFDSQPSTKSGKSIKSRLQTALQKASRVAAKDVPNETPKKSLITRAASKSSKRFSKLADIPLPTPKPPVETKDLPKKTGNRFTKLFRKKQ